MLIVFLDLLKSSEVFFAIFELPFFSFELYFQMGEFCLVELCLFVLQIFFNSQFLTIGHQLFPLVL
jgi:hypothetical protein